MKTRTFNPIDPPVEMRFRNYGKRYDVKVVGCILENAGDGCLVVKNKVIMPDGTERIVLNSDLYSKRS